MSNVPPFAAARANSFCRSEGSFDMHAMDEIRSCGALYDRPATPEGVLLCTRSHSSWLQFLDLNSSVAAPIISNQTRERQANRPDDYLALSISPIPVPIHRSGPLADSTAFPDAPKDYSSLPSELRLNIVAFAVGDVASLALLASLNRASRATLEPELRERFLQQVRIPGADVAESALAVTAPRFELKPGCTSADVIAIFLALRKALSANWRAAIKSGSILRSVRHGDVDFSSLATAIRAVPSVLIVLDTSVGPPPNFAGQDLTRRFGHLRIGSADVERLRKSCRFIRKVFKVTPRNVLRGCTERNTVLEMSQAFDGGRMRLRTMADEFPGLILEVTYYFATAFFTPCRCDLSSFLCLRPPV